VSANGRLKAHGVVLAASSQTFRSYLETSKIEGRVIEFPEMEHCILEIAIEYAYTGDIKSVQNYAQLAGYDKVMQVFKELGLFSNTEWLVYDFVNLLFILNPKESFYVILCPFEVGSYLA
jgi:BTB/POZ domain